MTRHVKEAGSDSEADNNKSNNNNSTLPGVLVANKIEMVQKQ